MVKFRPSIFYTLVATIPHLFFYMLTVILARWIDFLLFPESFKESRLGKLSTRVRNSWARQIIKMHGIEVEVQGLSPKELKEIRGTVFVSNHQSIVDVLVSMAMLPDNAAFVAKKELSRIPIFGRAGSAVGVIFIDRKMGTQNSSLRDVSEYLQRGGSVVLYPEGTRSRDGQLLPFKRGAFVLAIENQSPIVPITVKGSLACCPKGSFAIGPGKVTFVVGQPISTKGMGEDDRFRLAEEVRAVISKNL